jgi:predicted metalloprotease with PDZ domain
LTDRHEIGDKHYVKNWLFADARRVAACAAIVLLVGVGAAAAQDLEPIRYVISFSAPHTHYMEVEAVVPAGGQAHVELMMPVWTPGSYMVREFARHVEAFAASDTKGRLLGVEKTRKNRWRVSTGNAPDVVIKYRLYAHELTARTNWVGEQFALVNGAATFITLVERQVRPHEVKIILPPGWGKIMTALPVAPGGQGHHYRAPDFDTLVDSPIVAGNPTVYPFQVEGRPHYLVNFGETSSWDGQRAAADLEKVVKEVFKLWRQLPYDKYFFLNVVSEAGGALEHKNSTVLMSSPWSTTTRLAYLAWLSQACHELFHAWNVKRLRPIELGPFDYENENYTESLWIAEGFTDYYGDLLLARAGISSRAEYLQALSSTIESVQTTPGRLVQPVNRASFDAWIKFYRPDENSANTSVSYYTKGTVLAFLLDAKIRHATEGARSLDDLMRLAYERYSGPRGYTPEDFKVLVEDVIGSPRGVREWFASAVESAAELDYSEALDWFGLRFRETAEPPRASLGVTTRNDNGRLIITDVVRDGPAFVAGLKADDEILALGEIRIRATQLESRLASYQPGTSVSVLVVRRDALLQLNVTLGSDTRRRRVLETSPDMTTEQQTRLSSWLPQ